MVCPFSIYAVSGYHSLSHKPPPPNLPKHKNHLTTNDSCGTLSSMEKHTAFSTYSKEILNNYMCISKAQSLPSQLVLPSKSFNFGIVEIARSIWVPLGVWDWFMLVILFFFWGMPIVSMKEVLLSAVLFYMSVFLFNILWM
eukprot:TRINITY_DN17865_c0_g1_i1.p1 TRINITY_DN17865_c0_g1~~TRINITY_DN17865_c0_g1_i1.p1  ORF type:complete len:141 (+),score=10.99 TRINITY_DN17865_c0_g1_i1:156-578(+)